ncbi:phage tail assembly chaperone G [Mammaliicoccus sciuri]|uniref:phage tail assembly chaperone G n=1 Tax=Mammaliicoccus sciuri TaxID=1296 RepID=UPI002DBB1918|nr:hypothetical protein [Mammaliicoccus sciuri]MEB8265116.1 hypothetical protein [Mammaliicoccus sciuri]
MKRTSIELITGFTKTGKVQTKKYLAKPVITLYETIYGSKLSAKMKKVFNDNDIDELTEGEYEKLSETEKKEYNQKIEEFSEKAEEQFEVLDEVFQFVSDAFDNQFTPEELQKGLESGQKGFETLGTVLRNITSGGEPSDTKKFVEEKEK